MSNKTVQKNYSKQGDKLRSARKKLQLTQAEVAFQLKLSKSQISAIERGQLSAWEGAYEQGYVRSYGRLLDVKLNLENKVKEFEPNTSKPKVSERSFVASKFVASIFVAVSALLLLGYVIWQVIVLTSAPTLVLHEPEQDLLTKNYSTTISGRTDENVDISINDVSVLTDASGNFSVEVPLKPGVNNFTITATNRLTKQATEERTVVADYQIDTSVETE